MNLNEIVNPVLLSLAISTTGVATESSQKVYRTSHSHQQGFEEASIPSATCLAKFASDAALTTEVEDDSIQNETVSEAIASTRARLSLQVKELAQIFGVGRPTIYSWINEESSPHGRRLERIKKVAKAAKLWDKFSDLPAGNLVRNLVGGERLVDLLSKEEICEREVSEAMRSMAIKLENDVTELPSQSIDFGAVGDVKPQSEVVDAMTGKRIFLED